jgi:hypothetical protein
MKRNTKKLTAELEALATEVHRDSNRRTRNKQWVPMDCGLPNSNSVDGSRGWYHVAWTPETLAAARRNHFKIKRG